MAINKIVKLIFPSSKLDPMNKAYLSWALCTGIENLCRRCNSNLLSSQTAATVSEPANGAPQSHEYGLRQLPSPPPPPCPSYGGGGGASSPRPCPSYGASPTYYQQAWHTQLYFSNLKCADPKALLLSHQTGVCPEPMLRSRSRKEPHRFPLLEAAPRSDMIFQLCKSAIGKKSEPDLHNPSFPKPVPQ
jgi:hypothetical protein